MRRCTTARSGWRRPFPSRPLVLDLERASPGEDPCKLQARPAGAAGRARRGFTAGTGGRRPRGLMRGHTEHAPTTPRGSRLRGSERFTGLPLPRVIGAAAIASAASARERATNRDARVATCPRSATGGLSSRDPARWNGSQQTHRAPLRPRTSMLLRQAVEDAYQSAAGQDPDRVQAVVYFPEGYQPLYGGAPVSTDLPLHGTFHSGPRRARLLVDCPPSDLGQESAK